MMLSSMLTLLFFLTSGAVLLGLGLGIWYEDKKK